MKNETIEVNYKVNEFGDRMNKNDICSGILLIICIGGMISCAAIRGYQEIKKISKQSNVSILHTQKHQNTR